MAIFGTRKGDVMLLAALAAGRDAKDAASQRRRLVSHLLPPSGGSGLSPEVKHEAMVDRAVHAISYVSVGGSNPGQPAESQ